MQDSPSTSSWANESLGAADVVDLISELTENYDANDVVDHGQKRSNPGKSKTSSGKKRKTTYDVRREQKVEMTEQAEQMQKQLDELKYRVLVRQGEAAKSNERVAACNSVLHEFIQEQHVGLADLQAMLASNMQQNVQALQPAQTIIRLGKDQAERRKTLEALRTRKLREAKQFITARSRGLDGRSSHNQEERNSTPGEDFCLTIFENRPVIGASARDVFDAFIDVAQNAEIVISEMFGSITIRENNEADKRDISQMRLVTSTSKGTLMESNTVLFSEFVEAKDDKEESYGIVVADFVDSDELYPYRPEERVRRDTVTIFMIRSFIDSTPRSQDSAGKSSTKEDSTGGKERVVVGSRWTCSKIRLSDLIISGDVMQEIEESTVSYGDTMRKCIQQRLGKTGIWRVPGH